MVLCSAHTIRNLVVCRQLRAHIQVRLWKRECVWWSCRVRALENARVSLRRCSSAKMQAHFFALCRQTNRINRGYGLLGVLFNENVTSVVAWSCG